MHGNVWEWCADHWHDSYNFAPDNHLPWLIPGAPEDHPRLLRGGSWVFNPKLCRSAYRCAPLRDDRYQDLRYTDNYSPDDKLDDVGFRVCCLPQGCSS